MKTKLFDRLILWAGALFVAAVGVGLILLAFQTGGIELAREGESVVRLAAWVLVLVGGILFALALYGMSLPAKYRRSGGEFVVQKTPTGEMRISVKAMESLVRKVLANHKEATLKHMKLLHHRDALTVDLTVALAENVSIPLVVDALQKQIQQHIRTAAGVEVKQVRVSVETADAHAADSPYALQEQEKVLAESESPPVHTDDSPESEDTLKVQEDTNHDNF